MKKSELATVEKRCPSMTPEVELTTNLFGFKL